MLTHEFPLVARIPKKMEGFYSCNIYARNPTPIKFFGCDNPLETFANLV